MIGWIKDNIGIKNILILTLVVCVIVGFIMGPSWYKLIIGSQYKGVAEAQVTNIAVRTTSFQHHNGTNTKIVGYEITYYYEVENLKFSNTEFIEPGYDSKHLFDQFNSRNGCRIVIKYSHKTPSKSFISKLNLSK